MDIKYGKFEGENFGNLPTIYQFFLPYSTTKLVYTGNQWTIWFLIVQFYHLRIVNRSEVILSYKDC